MSIQETLQKIKSQVVAGKKPFGNHLTLIRFAAVFLLVFVGAFFVGRITAFSAGDREIEVIYPPLIATDIPKYEDKSDAESAGTVKKKTASQSSQNSPKSQKEPADWAFAASKSGKIYYPKDCKGLGRVKPENRVYFKTPEQAETAGLTLSKTCKNPS